MDGATSARAVARRLGLTKARLAATRVRVERSALAYRRPATRPGGRVLCYHTVGQPSYGINDVSPARFRDHLAILKADGYRFVDVDAIAETGGSDGDVAITFDDGARSVLEHAVPLLHKFAAPATCFVVSSWPFHVDEFARANALDWSGVRALRHAGVKIGSHSVGHPDFGRLSAAAASVELVESRRVLEEQLGEPIDTFAIPFGQSGNWRAEFTDLAFSAGYRSVFAQSEDRRPAQTIGRTFVTAADNGRLFRAALAGAFDGWEEWVP